MIGFTVLAVQVLLWQSQDISVAIVSETEEGSKEVIISVRNTAGSTLLFYENAEMTGKIEYLSEEGWVEYCDVSYTAGNAQAVSKLYGDKFAELEPGEDWSVTVPEEKVAGMKNGTYRIKMTYVTEKRYNEYLEASRNEIESEEDESEALFESSEDSSITETSDISFDISEEESAEVSDESLNEVSASNFFTDLIPTFNKNDKEASEPEAIIEKFHAESISEVYVKTFEYTAPEDFVSEISIDDSDIDVVPEEQQKRFIYREELIQ